MPAISFAELGRRLKGFVDNINDEVRDVVAENAEEIIRLQREQLYSGYNGDDYLIGQFDPYRSEEYAEEKRDQNPLPGLYNPDLYRTGDFYSKFELSVAQGSYNLTSTDSKTDKLLKKYGNSIFKANIPTKNTIRKTILKPELIIRLAENIGGQIV